MKIAITVAVVVLALLVWRQPQISHGDPQTAPQRADVDGDGIVSILDLAYVSQFFLKEAEPCLHGRREHYQTPVTAYQDGTAYFVEGRWIPDPNDPLISSLLAGEHPPACP